MSAKKKELGLVFDFVIAEPDKPAKRYRKRVYFDKKEDCFYIKHNGYNLKVDNLVQTIHVTKINKE